MEYEPECQSDEEDLLDNKKASTPTGSSIPRTRPLLTLLAFLTLAAGGAALAWLSVYVAQKLQKRSLSQGAEVRMLAQDPDQVFPVEIIDGLGRSTIWTSSPHRIISLAPSLTEMVVFWGGENRMVGVTRYCDWDKSFRPVKEIGGITDPSLEIIHSLEPDLILSSTLTPSSAISALDQQYNRHILVFSHSGWEGVEADLRAVAAALGVNPDTSEVGKDLFQRKKALKKQTAALAPDQIKSVLLLYGAEGLYTSGPGAFAYDLIELAGARNVTKGQSFEWAQISIEQVLLWDPDWILVTQEHNTKSQSSTVISELGSGSELDSNPGSESETFITDWLKNKKEDPVWSQLKAIKQEHVIGSTDPGWTTPGPRSLKTAENLYQEIYESDQLP